MFFAQCCCIFAETKPFYVMKTTNKQPDFRVSNRAYCSIISKVIDSMTGCRIDPFTFKQVVTAVSNYLKPEGRITGLCKKAKAIFDRLLPELDRSIHRSSTARAAAARRKAAKKTEDSEPQVHSEGTAEPESVPGKTSEQTQNKPAASAAQSTGTTTCRTKNRPAVSKRVCIKGVSGNIVSGTGTRARTRTAESL